MFNFIFDNRHNEENEFIFSDENINKVVIESKEELRKQLKEDIEVYLNNGGKITVIETPEYNNRPTSYTFNHNANIYRGNIVMLDDFG